MTNVCQGRDGTELVVDKDGHGTRNAGPPGPRSQDPGGTKKTRSEGLHSVRPVEEGFQTFPVSTRHVVSCLGLPKSRFSGPLGDT